MALVRTERFEEADRLLERGLARYPDDAGLLVEHALNAHLRGGPRDAIARWEKALTAAPYAALCHSSLAASLRHVGEFEAAGRIIAQARRRFPRDPSVLSEEAHIFEGQSLFADALPLWAQLSRRFNPREDWLRGHAHALVVLGRFEEAETAVTRSLRLHPKSQALLATEGILASSREDWPKAVELWTGLSPKLPGRRHGLGALRPRSARGPACSNR